MRIRSSLSFAIHEFFRKNEFLYVHTPIITSSDAEGAGQQFRVTTLNPNDTTLDLEGKVDFKKIFLVKKHI